MSAKLKFDRFCYSCSDLTSAQHDSFADCVENIVLSLSYVSLKLSHTSTPAFKKRILFGEIFTFLSCLVLSLQLKYNNKSLEAHTLPIKNTNS